MRRKWLAVLGAVVLLALLLAALRLTLLERRLTGRPEQRVAEVLPHEEVSFLSVSIRLRHDAVAELLNEQFPATIEIPEQDLVGGRSARTAVQGSGQVDRLEPIAVTGAGEGILATTSLKATYSLGNAIVGTETVQAEASVGLAAAFDIDASWKPIVALQPSIRWIRQPESRLTRMFNLPLGGLAEQQLQAMAGRIERQLPDRLEERFHLSAMILQAWEAAHARIQVSSEPEAWLTIRPLGAHFLTPRADAQALALDTGFSASLGVSQDPVGQTPDAVPLPPLSKQPPPVRGIRLSVPLTVDYRTLSDAIAAALRGQVFEFETGSGPAQVKINDAIVYPSAPQVVVGLHVEAAVPWQWLDTRGWIYLAAEPAFDPATGVLELRNLAFARTVDNRWVRVFSAALHDRLLRELQRHARWELAAPVEAATQLANRLLQGQLQQAMEERTMGARGLAERVVVSGGLEGIESASFSLSARGITLYPVVTGSLAIELVPLQGRPSSP